MIVSFGCADTRSLFLNRTSRRWSGVASVALRKLEQLDGADRLSDLRVPPGNRLEALHGARKGQYSIRVSDQWRICFFWFQDGAHEVEILDYH